MHDVTPRVGQRRWQAAVLALVITALIVLTNWLLSSTPALAHTDLAATRPGDGDVLIDPVSRIELEFSGAVDADGISIRLLDGNGRDILATTTQISEELVAIEPEQELDGGRYAVLWSVRSASDGHEISGSFSFEVSVASSGTGTNRFPTRSRLRQKLTHQTTLPSRMAQRPTRLPQPLPRRPRPLR